PRATRISRSMPRLWGRFWTVRRTFEYQRAQMVRPFEQLFERFDDTDFSLGTMIRCLIPGWAHARRGNIYRGRMYFLTYIFLLLTGCLFFGTIPGSMLVGLAFATHVASASDALVGQYSRVTDRLALTFGCATALGLLIYLPVGFAVSQHAVPFGITRPIESFAAGDVLWYNPSATIANGDIILYSVPETTLIGENNHTRYVLQNQWISRVVAQSGQRIQAKLGKLYVDDQPISMAPPVNLSAQFEAGIVVPEGSYLVMPNSIVPETARINMNAWRNLSVIPRNRIIGKVFFRSQPLWRMSTLTDVE
ncbi:MAG TPA: S26 family signal peptidase, partial [Lacipirellulaceae bacterium]|nr:S26 family signal peptidase [Lacipirellulaceae bacterium]